MFLGRSCVRNLITKCKKNHLEQPGCLIFWMTELPFLYCSVALAATVENVLNKLNLVCGKEEMN